MAMLSYLYGIDIIFNSLTLFLNTSTSQGLPWSNLNFCQIIWPGALLQNAPCRRKFKSKHNLYPERGDTMYVDVIVGGHLHSNKQCCKLNQPS